MTNGAKASASWLGGPETSRPHVASRPSPSEESSPTPVMTTSRRSVTQELLERELERSGHVQHGLPEGPRRVRDDPIGQPRAAHHLALATSLTLGHCEARAVMDDVAVELQLMSGEHRLAELRLLHARERWQSGEAIDRAGHPATRLRHAFDQQHARHEREAGEVPLEDRA